MVLGEVSRTPAIWWVGLKRTANGGYFRKSGRVDTQTPVT